MMFDRIFDLFRGKAVTIPPLDGAFRPNTALDDAACIADLPGADNLALYRGEVIASSGNDVHVIGAAARHLQRYPSAVSAVAVGPDGMLAVGLDSGVLIVDGQTTALPDQLRCITALAYGTDGCLWLANGSDRHAPSEWVADLMERNAAGSVWTLRDGRFSKVAAGLAYPCGLRPDPRGVIVSESWRHRLILLDGQSGTIRRVLESLPGYPGRIVAGAHGGAWLTLFAPRNRLIEFVLQEPQYRAAMMAEVPRDFWVAPALSSGRNFLEPLQCGGIKTMGVHKAWSPSRSHGLVACLDADMMPVSSLHSRADGTRHGVCSVLDHDGHLLVAAKGGDCVVTLPEGGR